MLRVAAPGCEAHSAAEAAPATGCHSARKGKCAEFAVQYESSQPQVLARRVTNLHESVAAKERELGEATHRNLAEHNAKDAQFASKVSLSCPS